MRQSGSGTLKGLAKRYAAAWNAHDIDTIMSLHHPRGTYQLHDARRETVSVQGTDGIRKAFAIDLANLPVIHFELTEMHEGADHIVFRSRLTATTRTDHAIDVNTIDLLTIHDGLVFTKHTFVGGPYKPQSKETGS